VLVGLPPEAAIAKEEFFGPVAMIIPSRPMKKRFASPISLTSSQRCGLERDLVRARRVAGEIESGMVLSMISPVPIPRTVRRLQGFRVWARTWRSGARELTNPKLIWQAA